VAAVVGLRIGGILQGLGGNLPGRLDGDFLRAALGRPLQLTLLVQYPVQHPVTQHLGDFLVPPESLHQEENFLTHEPLAKLAAVYGSAGFSCKGPPATPPGFLGGTSRPRSFPTACAAWDLNAPRGQASALAGGAWRLIRFSRLTL